MKPYEYNDILTGLITSVSGLKERRPSAGRGLLMESLLADTVELTESLKTGNHGVSKCALDIEYQ